jgi:peptidoglycan/LPS O-acetylase OafA/YrhL
MHSELGRAYIPTLNGWRAIAVSLVICAHSATFLRNSGTEIGAVAASIVSHAGIGVDVFFAISGFLISSLLLKEKDEAGSIRLEAFYIRRAFRILPPMLVYLAVLSILKISGEIPSIEPEEIISSLLFFRNYVFHDGSWYTVHFWSLAVEEHFYFFVPIVLSAFSWKSSLRFAIAIVVCCAVARYLEYASMAANVQVDFRTEARIDAIMYGAIGALLIHTYRSLFEERLTGTVALVIVGAALISCVVFPAMPVRRTVIAAAMPFLIIFTVLRPRSILGRILELAPMQWIGRMSYSLYIWQMLFLVSGARALPFLQSFPVAFGCIPICALASYYLIERPMIKIGHSIAAPPAAWSSGSRRMEMSGSVLGGLVATIIVFIGFAVWLRLEHSQQLGCQPNCITDISASRR